VVPIGESGEGDAQHSGLGAQLIAHAKQMALEAGYAKLAVISAVGTQGYYAKHGFVVDGLYMTSGLVGSK
jgi:elongator complex protein 3